MSHARPPRSVFLAAAALLLAACPADEPTPGASGSSSGGDSSGSTSTSAGETTARAPTSGTEDEPSPVTPECLCFETQGEFSVEITNTCSIAWTCDLVEIQCPVGAPGCPLTDGLSEGELSVDDEAALECILTALRDGTEGSVQWLFTGADLPGWERRQTYVRTLSERRAITHTLAVVDLGGPWSDVTVEGLAPAADFDACLAATELVDRVACLIAPTDGEVFEVCTEGGAYEEL